MSELPANSSDDTTPAILTDTTLCTGCEKCVVACKNEHDLNERDRRWRGQQSVDGLSSTRFCSVLREPNDRFVRHQCRHCKDPACASACPVHALDDGPVTYDAKRCIGCRYCMVACPFQVPRFEWDETIPQVAKCTFCNDRLAVGDGPACAESCPTGALIWGTRGQLLAEAQQRLALEPGRYEGLYGDDEAGGTSVLYLSHVPFDKLGLPDLGTASIPALSNAMGPILLPAIFLGGAAILAGGHYLTGREREDKEE